MMWCIHSFFQKPCFFGYQMKSLFAYQSGCKKAASSLILAREHGSQPAIAWSDAKLSDRMWLCSTRRNCWKCFFLKLGNRRFSTKKMKQRSEILDGFFGIFFFPLLKLPAKVPCVCGTRAGYRPSIQAENGWECANGYIGKAEVFCLPSGGRFKPWELEGSPQGVPKWKVATLQVFIKSGWLQDRHRVCQHHGSVT